MISTKACKNDFDQISKEEFIKLSLEEIESIYEFNSIDNYVRSEVSKGKIIPVLRTIWTLAIGLL